MVELKFSNLNSGEIEALAYHLGEPISVSDEVENAYFDALAKYYELQQSFSGILNWDAQSGTAALVGAIVAGAATGLVSFLIFRQGMLKERERLIQERKFSVSNGATTAYFKSLELLDQGIKSGSIFVDTLNRHSMVAWPISPSGHLLPSVISLPPAPEMLIAELSFLLEIGQAELLQEMLELARWSVHLKNLVQTFSELKTDWGYWSVRNGEDTAAKDGVMSVSFRGAARAEAEMRVRSMDDVAKEALRSALERDRQISVFKKYEAVCRENFPEIFGNFTESEFKDLPAISPSERTLKG